MAERQAIGRTRLGTENVESATAMIALVMAAVGTYGVTSYLVARRTHELGVRVAVGAIPGDVVRLVVRGSARLALAGVALGLLGALALGRGMQAILFDTSASDPVVLGGTAVLLGVVALLAGYFPERRASMVAPVAALQSD